MKHVSRDLISLPELIFNNLMNNGMKLSGKWNKFSLYFNYETAIFANLNAQQMTQMANYFRIYFQLLPVTCV